MKNALHLVVSLTLISAVCAAILATVDGVTKKQIAQIREQAALNAAKQVMPAVSDVRKLPVAPGEPDAFAGVNAQGKPVAYAVQGRDAHGYGGDVVLMVGFTPSFKIISYRKLEASETPGLGSNLTSEEFTKQFKGMDATVDLAVKKDGGDVQAITSATITSRAVCGAINAARDTLKKLLAASRSTKK